MDISMRAIAHIQSEFPTKFGVPRQSGLVPSLESTVVFTPEFRNSDALRGIEGFSHLWLIWVFDRSARETWSPTVRPPRLGGNQRMGIFATRSPFRPNPIGLSCVELAGIETTPTWGTVLRVRGADLADGSPILDIKPYIPYADSHPGALEGFASVPAEALEVVDSPGSPAADSLTAAGSSAWRVGPGPPSPLSGGPSAGLWIWLCRHGDQIFRIRPAVDRVGNQQLQIASGILSSRQYLRPWQCLGRPAAAGHPRPFTQKLLRFPSFPPGHPGTYPSW